MEQRKGLNKGGRPKAAKGKARTKTISTRLTMAEWKTVMKRITDAGKKPSHFLRELLLYGKVVAARTQEDRKQIRMLEGGCNNLNQLAKLAHQQGFPRTKERIMEQTLLFSIFVCTHLWYMFNTRSFETGKGFFQLKMSKEFFTIVAIIFIGQIVIVEVLYDFFNCTPMKLMDWIIIVVLSSLVLWVRELWHLLTKRG